MSVCASNCGVGEMFGPSKHLQENPDSGVVERSFSEIRFLLKCVRVCVWSEFSHHLFSTAAARLIVRKV